LHFQHVPSLKPKQKPELWHWSVCFTVGKWHISCSKYFLMIHKLKRYTTTMHMSFLPSLTHYTLFPKPPLCLSLPLFVRRLATRLNYLHIRFAFSLFVFPRMPCTSSIFPLCTFTPLLLALLLLLHCFLICSSTLSVSLWCLRWQLTPQALASFSVFPALVPLPHNECNF